MGLARRSTMSSILLLAATQLLSSSIMMATYLPTLFIVTSSIPSSFAQSGGASTPPMTAAQLRNAAEEALSKQDYNTAVTYFGRLLDVEKSQLNYFKRASVYIRKKQYAQAVADLSDAILLDSEFVKGYEHRAKIYAMRGDCVQALSDYQMLAKLKPKKPPTDEITKTSQCVTALQQSEAAMQRHDWESAKHWLTQAMDVAYDSEKLLMQRIRCHLSLNDHQSVLVDTRKILSHDKTHLDALSVRGQAYYALGEHDTALTHWREGLRLAPEHKEMKDAYTKLRLMIKKETSGDEAAQAGRHTEAIKLFNEALAVDPAHTIHNIKIQIKHCNSLIHSKQALQAIDSCTKAINMDQSNIDAWCKRGEARLVAEQWDEAIQDYQHAVGMNQQHHPAQEGLQRAQMEKKKAGRKDYYKILGVEKSANERTIKRAFRKLALIWHPDKHQDDTKEEAEKKFREIADAHDVLSDPELRAKYDRGEDVQAGANQQQQHQHNPFEGFHFQQGGPQFQFRWG